MYYYKTCTNWKCCVCFVLAGYKLEHVEHLGCWISKIVDCFLFVMCHIVFIVFTLVPKLKWGNVQMYSSGFFYYLFSHVTVPWQIFICISYPIIFIQKYVTTWDLKIFENIYCTYFLGFWSTGTQYNVHFYHVILIFLTEYYSILCLHQGNAVVIIAASVLSLLCWVMVM